MAQKPSDYWAKFGRFKDNTAQVQTNKGPSSTVQTGAKYDFHDGDAVGEQKGNKSTIHTGWSNSLLRGFSFSTTLGQSTSTTVGNSFSNHSGFKFTMFIGPEMTVLGSMALKLTKSPYYEIGKAVKYEVGTLTACSVAEEKTMATKISTIAGQQVSTLTGYAQVVSGKWTASSSNYSVTAVTLLDLWSGASMQLKSTLVNIESKTSLKLKGTASVAMTSGGAATINGAIIRVG